MAAELTAPESQFWTWVAYTVAAPIGVFIISWPIAKLCGLSYPFLSTFGTADIIPLAALILCGAAADIEHESIFGNQRLKVLLFLRHAANLVAFFSLAGYGALKAKALTLLSHEPIRQDDQWTLFEISCVAIVVLLLALAVAYYAKSRLMACQLAAGPQAGA